MKNEKLVREWIDATENDKRNGEFNHWAIDEVLDWRLENRFDDLWEFVKCAYQEQISLKVTSNLAAGPLEDLLA